MGLVVPTCVSELPIGHLEFSVTLMKSAVLSGKVNAFAGGVQVGYPKTLAQSDPINRLRRTRQLRLLAGLLIGLAFASVTVPAATMVRLSLDDMVAKSTSIVRGKVLDSGTAVAGQVIFTHYRVQVMERLKGSALAVVDVAVPGGVAGGIRQNYSGVPRFQPGEEYVFFLWTGKAGPTQVIGLTQGLFALAANTGGDPMATRQSSHELMLDARSHQPVKDETLVMPLSQLRSKIQSGLKAAK